jgi:hypothetical protein
VVGLSAALTATGLLLGPALLAPLFGPQWAPALGPLLIFLAQTPLDALAALMLPVIYAAGLAGRGLRLSAAWVTLTWLFCSAALWLWRDLRAIPLGFALATLCAVLLIARSLPPDVHVRWGRWFLLGAGVLAMGLVITSLAG